VENLRIQPFVDDSKQFNEYDDGMYLKNKEEEDMFHLHFIFRKSLYR